MLFRSSSDISLPLNLVEKPFDLVISVEVAEHIECSKVDTYLENLVHLGEVILFSAAIPWQGGLHHVNEQWPSYWVERFALKGYIPVDCLREKIWSDEDICPHYRQNLMFFIKETSIERYSALKNEIAMGKSRVLDLVHPEYYKRLNDVKKMSFKWTLSQFLNFLSALLQPAPSDLAHGADGHLVVGAEQGRGRAGAVEQAGRADRARVRRDRNAF